ncbi:MAG: DUF167 domain-containing protein [Aquificae bacterium]|nr:DUF167 domain-containing protein [Aquificota bacterium]
MIVTVYVKPLSKKEGVRKLGENTYEVRVKEPPSEGRANERLLVLLSEHLRVPKSALRILRGHTSRKKLVEVEL